MHQLAPPLVQAPGFSVGDPALAHYDKKLNMYDLNNFIKFASGAPIESFGSASNISNNFNHGEYFNQRLVQNILLQQQNGINPSMYMAPLFGGGFNASGITKDHQPLPKSPTKPLKRKLSDGVSRRRKVPKSSKSESDSKSVSPPRGVPPKKEHRMKGHVYIVQNERKKWDGRQWRRLCVAENCSCAARGATKYCVNHGKKKFNINVKHYRRSNIPPGLEGLITEPKERKKIKAQIALPMQVKSKSPVVLPPDVANSDLMHILAQAALSGTKAVNSKV